MNLPSNQELASELSKQEIVINALGNKEKGVVFWAVRRLLGLASQYEMDNQVVIDQVELRKRTEQSQ